MKQVQDIHELSKDVKLRNTVFESSECYGMGKYIRKYGFYPRWLPLFVSTDHGPSQRDAPTYLELSSGSPHTLFHSRRLVAKWKELSKMPCDVMVSPFVFYRRRSNINKSENARGTLAFPVHTTDLIENDCDYEGYAKSLLVLPSEYQPVSVCIYHLDVRKGKHKIFEKYNIPVYTAGHIYDSEFVIRFYDILKNFAFTTSNHVGSYVFYAVEMGIPFFIYGNRPIMINKGDPNCPDGAYDPLKLSSQLGRTASLFEGVRPDITKEQRELVEAELGLDDGVGRLKMAVILYSSILKWIFSRRSIGYIWSRFCGSISPYLRHIFYFVSNGLTKEAKILTHLTPEEKITLHRFAKSLAPRSIVVEIGSYFGASSCFLADGLMCNDGELYCIDTWQNQTMPEGEMDTFSAFEANTARYRNKIKSIKGLSETVANDFARLNKKIKLLFIDGDHSYEACRTDWELYSPFLSNNAIVVFHDTGWAEGVNKVIREYVAGRALKIMDLPNMQAYRMT